MLMTDRLSQRAFKPPNGIKDTSSLVATSHLGKCGLHALYTE